MDLIKDVEQLETMTSGVLEDDVKDLGVKLYSILFIIPSRSCSSGGEIQCSGEEWLCCVASAEATICPSSTSSCPGNWSGNHAAPQFLTAAVNAGELAAI